MTTDNQAANILAGENLLSRIARHVFITILHIGWAKLGRQVDSAEVTVPVGENDVEVDEALRTNPQWRLIPKHWADRFGKIESRARRLVRSASQNFASAGLAVIPITRATEIFQALRAARAEFNTAKEDFCAQYTTLLNEIRTKIPDRTLANKVVATLPNADKIRDKFVFTWAILPVGGGNTADMVHVTEAIGYLQRILDNVQSPSAEKYRLIEMALTALRQTATDAPQVRDAEANQLIQEARTQMAEFTNEVVTNMANEPRQEAISAIQNVIDAIQTAGRNVRQGTLDQAIRNIRLMEGFSFLLPEGHVQAIRDARRELDESTPQELNAEGATGTRLVRILNRVLSIITNEKQVQETVSRFRGIYVEETPSANPSKPEPVLA